MKLKRILFTQEAALELYLKLYKRNPIKYIWIMEAKKKIVFIKDWILNYVNSMPKKAKSLVVGVSWGIDSSVTSTLCALTGLKTIVLSMPINQISSQHDLSIKHKNWLKEKFNLQ